MPITGIRLQIALDLPCNRDPWIAWHPQIAPEYGGEGPIVYGPEAVFAAPDSR